MRGPVPVRHPAAPSCSPTPRLPSTAIGLCDAVQSDAVRIRSSQLGRSTDQMLKLSALCLQLTRLQFATKASTASHRPPALLLPATEFVGLSRLFDVIISVNFADKGTRQIQVCQSSSAAIHLTAHVTFGAVSSNQSRTWSLMLPASLQFRITPRQASRLIHVSSCHFSFTFPRFLASISINHVIVADPPQLFVEHRQGDNHKLGPLFNASKARNLLGTLVMILRAANAFFVSTRGFHGFHGLSYL